MTLYAEKEVFNLLGLEAIQPSLLHTSQDCVICTQPLAVQPSRAQEEMSQSKLHTAVRIMACGHIVGEECLDAWLDTSHMCPVCNRELFDAKGNAITQQDVDRIVQSLSQYYGIYRVKASISRVTKRVGGKYIPRQPAQGGGVRDEEMDEEDFGYSGGEVWDSEEEIEFDEEEEEDDEYMELDGEEESEDEEVGDGDDAETKEVEEKNMKGSEE